MIGAGEDVLDAQAQVARRVPPDRDLPTQLEGALAGREEHVRLPGLVGSDGDGVMERVVVEEQVVAQLEVLGVARAAIGEPQLDGLAVGAPQLLAARRAKWPADERDGEVGGRVAQDGLALDAVELGDRTNVRGDLEQRRQVERGGAQIELHLGTRHAKLDGRPAVAVGEAERGRDQRQRDQEPGDEEEASHRAGILSGSNPSGKHRRRSYRQATWLPHRATPTLGI